MKFLKNRKQVFIETLNSNPLIRDKDDIKKKYEQLEGIVPTADRQSNFNILEMHVDLNLEEFTMENPPKEVKIPYIVTVDEGSK